MLTGMAMAVEMRAGAQKGNKRMELELHPLCTLFPRMAGAEFDSLVADIKLNGQREPIILHDGMILDGGNRYRACLAAGIEPATMKFGGGNIVSYVLSANLHRRHMSAGQQAAIVSSAQNWAQAQPHGGDRKSKKIKVQDCTLMTSEDRAAQSGASLRTQKDADKVAKASPELARQVAHGEKSLPKAVKEVTGKQPKPKAAKPQKPEAAPDELAKLKEENAALREANAEQGQAVKELLAENEIVCATDQLAAALAECKKLRELVRVLEERNRGLQNEKNEAIRSAKSWQRRCEKLEKVAA
jgi:hypothetical protein